MRQVNYVSRMKRTDKDVFLYRLTIGFFLPRVAKDVYTSALHYERLSPKNPKRDFSPGLLRELMKSTTAESSTRMGRELTYRMD